jgi:hypothetical protein
MAGSAWGLSDIRDGVAVFTGYGYGLYLTFVGGILGLIGILGLRGLSGFHGRLGQNRNRH